MSEKIELKEKLAAVDQNVKELWDAMDATQQKALKGELFILNRYISSVKSSKREIQEHFILTVNEYYNKHWNTLQKGHPKLLWMLLCMCSYDNETVFWHEWIGNKKEGASNKKEAILEKFYPNMKHCDIELLSSITTNKEIKEYCEQLGWDKKEIANLKL
jgi:hypothetical protein